VDGTGRDYRVPAVSTGEWASQRGSGGGLAERRGGAHWQGVGGCGVARGVAAGQHDRRRYWRHDVLERGEGALCRGQAGDAAPAGGDAIEDHPGEESLRVGCGRQAAAQDAVRHLWRGAV